MLQSSHFQDVPEGPKDPMFDLKMRTDNDPSIAKIDLGAGVYRTEDGGYYELAVVKKAKEILNKQNLGHDYEFTTGNQEFLSQARQLVFGTQSRALRERRIASVQTISGTGANHLGAVFLRKFLQGCSGNVYIGTPAWGNYQPLFELAGFNTVMYRYYNREEKTLDFETIRETVQRAPRKSIFVLQGCCHNPTGLDLSKEQWIELAQLLKDNEQFPFMDIAYQGFGDGMENDAFAVRHFAQQGLETAVCQSFSKNMGLYGERVGALHIIMGTASLVPNIVDQLRCLIRWEFSSSPAYGARLVTIILRDEELNRQWRREVEQMRLRLRNSRSVLYWQLTNSQTPGEWKHILAENGLFSFLSLQTSQIETLAREFHIYLPSSGRINIAGLNERSMDIVARALDYVV